MSSCLHLRIVVDRLRHQDPHMQGSHYHHLFDFDKLSPFSGHDNDFIQDDHSRQETTTPTPVLLGASNDLVDGLGTAGEMKRDPDQLDAHRRRATVAHRLTRSRRCWCSAQPSISDRCLQFTVWLAGEGSNEHRRVQGGLTGKVDGMLLDELLGLVRVETGEREHALQRASVIISTGFHPHNLHRSRRSSRSVP